MTDGHTTDDDVDGDVTRVSVASGALVDWVRESKRANDRACARSHKFERERERKHA